MNITETNPKDIIGKRKAGLSCVPSRPLMELGVAMLEGSLKYGSFNWRHAGVKSSIYYDAAIRHITAYIEGQDIDPDSGLSHITKAIACLVVLRDSQMIGNVVDDRPPSHKDNWQKDLNDKAAKLIEQYPEPKAAYVRNNE